MQLKLSPIMFVSAWPRIYSIVYNSAASGIETFSKAVFCCRLRRRVNFRRPVLETIHCVRVESRGFIQASCGCSASSLLGLVWPAFTLKHVVLDLSTAKLFRMRLLLNFGQNYRISKIATPRVQLLCVPQSCRSFVDRCRIFTTIPCFHTI